MVRSAKGAGAINEAVARGIQITAKRTIPKGKSVARPLWTPELTGPNEMVQRYDERKRGADPLAEEGAC
ncbi:hypothetical protein ERJ75_001345200 [Trypanosoma vivax]|nr:hypothetical protein ERJ75_001345200 [Trypanosoma vivax]